jgi:hypothetical protein
VPDTDRGHGPAAHRAEVLHHLSGRIRQGATATGPRLVEIL